MCAAAATALALATIWTLVPSVIASQARSADGKATAAPLVIRGGTVLTITRGTIPNGTVIVRDGKIAAVGANLDVPPGAEVVDAAGKFVSPGVIDEHSHIAIDSVNESGTTVSSMTSVWDVLNPTDVDIYRDLAGGLTVASVYHGSANPIGGTNTVIKLRWGKKRAADLVFDAALPGLKFALGENPKDIRQAGQAGPRRYPLTRLGVEYVLRDAFTRAREYRKAWADYEKRKKAGEDVLAPRRDFQLEPIAEVLEGKRLAHVHAYRADEMLMVMRLAEEFGFKVATFEHGLEGYKVAKELAAHGAGVGTFSDWWGYKIEAIDAIPYNAALMMKAGVVVSINSDSAEHARRLNTESAKMMHWGGLTEDKALALFTINPAKQLRVDKRVGSIEAGKDADLVVWSAHPLSSYAVVEKTIIDGVCYYDRQKDLEKVAAVAKEKADLVAAEKAAAQKSPGGRGAGAGAGAGAGTGADDRPASPSSAATSSLAPSSAHTSTIAAAIAANPGNLPTLDAAWKTPVPPPGVLAIRNARIFPVTQPAIERGTIVVRDGRIVAVGVDVAVPSGAKVIEGSGLDVYPGWINARTVIGLSEPGARGYEDTTEMLDFNPELRTRVAYHSESDTIAVARANGVTTIGVFPNGGILGGPVAVMNLDGWTWEEATVEPVSGITFQFPGVGGGGRGGGGGGAPQGEGTPERTYDDLRRERDQRLEPLVRLLDQARDYAKTPAADRKTDWTLDALVPVVERKIPLVAAAQREQDIRDAVAFAEKVGVKVVIAAGAEAAFAAPLLKEKNVPVILTGILSLPTREDLFHAASYQAAGVLAKAGVTFAFATGDNANVRQVPYLAAMSVAWGLERDQAIRALTIDAARILGVADRLGSIEPGKMANLILTRGDPLEVRTEVMHVIVNGQDAGTDNKHRALYERHLGRK